jgi:hypothetical protein
MCKTTDGGKHWRLVPEITNCNDILIDKRGIVWFASSRCDTFSISLDSGKSFIKKVRLCMIRIAENGSTLFCSSYGTAIYSTNDKGDTWQKSSISTNSIIPLNGWPDLYGITFSSNFTGLALGNAIDWVDVVPPHGNFEALILITFNGGMNWVVPGPPPNYLPGFLSAVQTIDSSNFMVVGDSAYIAKVGADNLYESIFLEPITRKYFRKDAVFEDLKFFSVSRGFVIGSFGLIYYTENGGAFWSKIPSPDSTTLRKITFTDSANGWIVGANRVILHTNNGGWVGGTSEVRIPSEKTSVNSLSYDIDRREWILLTQNTIGNLRVSILSVLGINLLNNVYYEKLSDNKYSISLNGMRLPSGFYIAKFQGEDQTFTLPLILR